MACAWFLVALSNTEGGSRQAAREGYEKIIRRLTPDQVKRARTDAQNWMDKIESLRAMRRRAVDVLANPWALGSGNIARSS